MSSASAPAAPASTRIPRSARSYVKNGALLVDKSSDAAALRAAGHEGTVDIGSDCVVRWTFGLDAAQALARWIEETKRAAHERRALWRRQGPPPKQ